MKLFKEAIEQDLNPFVVFSHKGDITYLNSSADLLLAYSNSNELYRLALTCAPKHYGTKTSHRVVEFGPMLYDYLMVGYQDDEFIWLRLYHKRNHSAKPINSNQFILSNINTLLEVNISLFSEAFKGSLSLEADLDIPPFYMEQNSFSRLLQNLLSSLQDAKDIRLFLGFSIGEYLKINNRRHKLITLKIISSKSFNINTTIESLCAQQQIKLFHDTHTLRLQIPFVEKVD